VEYASSLKYLVGIPTCLFKRRVYRVFGLSLKTLGIRITGDSVYGDKHLMQQIYLKNGLLKNF